MGVEMSASTSIPASGIPYETAMSHAHAWPVVLNWLRRSRAPRAERAMTGCFGALTVKDKMVIKGLAASLACAAEPR